MLSPLVILLLVLVGSVHGFVEQILLTRTPSQGVAVTWVAFPPLPPSSSPSSSPFSLLYGPRSKPLAFSVSPTHTFVYPKDAPSAWNGTVFYAPLPPLLPDEEYIYAVQESVSGRLASNPASLRSPPDLTDDVKLLVLANIGVADAAQAVGAAAMAVVQEAWTSELPVSAVLLPGDLSFSGGSSDVADEWARRVSAGLGSAVPLLSGVGHAELENDVHGTAYLTRLGHSMPNSNNNNNDSSSNSTSELPFSYSHDVGLVHIIVVDSSANLSQVRTWLEESLKQADAKRTSGETHFVVLLLHAALFSSSSATDQIAAASLRASLLPLLGSVDVVIASHPAAYERTCQLSLNVSANAPMCATNNGSVHLTLGSGGRAVDVGWSTQGAPDDWSRYREAELGFVQLSAFHNDSMLIEFFRANGTVGDSVLIVRKRTGTEAGAVLVLASLLSLGIVGAAVVIVLFLMRNLGRAPPERYDELVQEERQEKTEL